MLLISRIPRSCPAVALAALSLSGVSSGVIAEAPQQAASFEVVIRPETNAGGRVDSLLITETILRTEGDAPFAVSAPLSLAGIVPIATQMRDVRIASGGGDLQVRIEDVEGEDGIQRRWIAAQQAGPIVTVRYQVSVPPLSGRGPPYPVVAAGDGIAGNTMTLIAIPEDFVSRTSTLKWDLAELPAGSIGVATGGEGALMVNDQPSALLDRWIIAGSAQIARAPEGSGFSAYTIGRPPFDAQAVMAWSRSAYDALAGAYGYLGKPPYKLLIRGIDGPSFGTGTAANAGGGSLISIGDAYWTGQDEASTKAIIFHEMGHQWVGRLEDDGGLWFAEGLNVYITATLPCEAGLTPWAACAADISRNAHDYYISPGRSWSQDDVEATGMAREDVRRVSYGRGMLYFADLDAEIRRHSGGTRTLLDALCPLFVARKAGHGLTLAVWEAFLRDELGQAAVSKFQRLVLDGADTMTPADDAFGPHVRRFPAHWEIEGKTISGFRWEAVEPSRPNPE